MVNPKAPGKAPPPPCGEALGDLRFHVPNPAPGGCDGPRHVPRPGDPEKWRDRGPRKKKGQGTQKGGGTGDPEGWGDRGSRKMGGQGIQKGGGTGDPERRRDRGSRSMGGQGIQKDGGHGTQKDGGTGNPERRRDRGPRKVRGQGTQKGGGTGDPERWGDRGPKKEEGQGCDGASAPHAAGASLRLLSLPTLPQRRTGGGNTLQGLPPAPPRSP